jgi:glycosyltransferase involved in cell wall biosynthesis
MKISVIHPSRNRPDQASATINKWLNSCDNRDNVDYILSLDTDDTTGYCYFHLTGLVKILHNPNKTAIEAINFAATKAIGDLLVVASDDMDCPEHWDTLLIEALKGKEDFCAKINDGHQDWIITLPIMDRKYYERLGYIYHPGFAHMFADTHMTCVAWMTGRYVPVNLLFTHKHNNAGYGKRDALNIRNDRTWAQGQYLFRRLRRLNFEIPLNEIAKEIPDISGLNVPKYR